MSDEVLNADCLQVFADLKRQAVTVDLTFLDPPFNQAKAYRYWNDRMDERKYWEMMKQVCAEIFDLTKAGGSIYFMQREKNTAFVLNILRETGWTLQNLIIWKKKTSAVPVPNKFGKQYQVIAYATKGTKARIFNRLRIDSELPSNYKHKRPKGLFVTDVWDDIRELTSGFFAGREAIRAENGERFHKQQAPIALLLRIILASSAVGDTILDPYAGTGTTAVVAHQLQRFSIAIEIDPANVDLIHNRIKTIRKPDLIQKYLNYYRHTENIDRIWGSPFEDFSKSEEVNKLMFCRSNSAI